jgi:hypothetical protein
MGVRSLCVPIRVLAMFVRGVRMLLSFFMIPMIVMVGRLAMVMGRSLMMCRRVMMVLARHVFLFFGHESFSCERRPRRFGKMAF